MLWFSDWSALLDWKESGNETSFCYVTEEKKLFQVLL